MDQPVDSATQAKRQDFYDRLGPKNLAPLWEVLKGLMPNEPTSKAVRAFLGRVIRTAGAKPRHLVCDQGPQFSCDEFKSWCRRKDIRPRFGAIGEHGTIAVIERLILTLKQSIARLMLGCQCPPERGFYGMPLRSGERLRQSTSHVFSRLDMKAPPAA